MLLCTGCGHCKNLKPDWEEAATQLKDEEAAEKLAAMDATKYREIADRYKVRGGGYLLSGGSRNKREVDTFSSFKIR